ncbi:TIR domain-containing protein [Providencia rettgeri]|nr:TIR domain-containing protein [Providencia rettgeri]
MELTQHRVFISYHHDNDQWAKEELIELNKKNSIFIDKSLPLDGISETKEDGSNKTDDEIRIEIRDNYLRSTSVVLLLVGTETKNRKHVDWELYSSMRDSPKNKKSSIVVIQLPSTNPRYMTIPYSEQYKKEMYPNFRWTSIDSRTEYESRYPYLPQRIIDNLLTNKSKIAVIHWSDLLDEIGEVCTDKIRHLIDNAFLMKDKCEYDMHRRMRERNS